MDEPSLLLLIQKRDFDFNTFNRKIIESFAKKLTTAVQMGMSDKRPIRWTRVYAYKPIQGFVAVIGYVEIRVGDMLQLAGDEQVLITEANIGQFYNKARYIVNHKVLQHGNVDALHQHLVFVNELRAKATDEEIVEILSNEVYDETSLLANPQLQPILDQLTRPKIVEDFDATVLTDEQLRGLRAHSKATSSIQ